MTLKKQIDEYGRLKAMADAYKKDADACNKKIKALMAKDNLEEECGEQYKVIYYVQNKQSLNEEKALDILKRAGVTKCVKTVEVLDSDALESMLYNGELPNEVVTELATCRSSKQVPALKVTKLEDGNGKDNKGNK